MSELTLLLFISIQFNVQYDYEKGKIVRKAVSTRAEESTTRLFSHIPLSNCLYCLSGIDIDRDSTSERTGRDTEQTQKRKRCIIIMKDGVVVAGAVVEDGTITTMEEAEAAE